MKLVLISAGVCLFFIVFAAACRGDKKVTRAVIDKAIILDVRTPTEFGGGHIPGAVNIPLSKLRDTALHFDTGSTLITYCSHGLRSKKAAAILKSRGYTKTYDGGAMSALERKMHGE